ERCVNAVLVMAEADAEGERQDDADRESDAACRGERGAWSLRDASRGSKFPDGFAVGGHGLPRWCYGWATRLRAVPAASRVGRGRGDSMVTHAGVMRPITRDCRFDAPAACKN